MRHFMVDPDNEERLLKVPRRVVDEIKEEARAEERSNNFTPDDHADAMTEMYAKGQRDALADNALMNEIRNEQFQKGLEAAVQRVEAIPLSAFDLGIVTRQRVIAAIKGDSDE
jgi:hypothetical protein